MVVDFPIERQPDPAICAEHRLVTRSEIDDGQPLQPQSDAAVGNLSLIVRSTMLDGCTHPRQHESGLMRVRQGRIDKPDNSAHAALYRNALTTPAISAPDDPNQLLRRDACNALPRDDVHCIKKGFLADYMRRIGIIC